MWKERRDQLAVPPKGNPLREGRPDRLIDAVVYLIPPTNFSKSDQETIAELSKDVLVIPVVAKSDAFTTEELAKFQQLIEDRLAQST